MFLMLRGEGGRIPNFLALVWHGAGLKDGREMARAAVGLYL